MRDTHPHAAAVRSVRVDAGLTQTAAAELVHTSLRSWQQWEAGARRMHPAFWELFLLKVRGCPQAASHGYSCPFREAG
jgi:DNA-binding transcriptional regulator YiaG